MSGAMRVDFPYLMADRDRHGNQRVYVRKEGRKVRIREPLGSPGFARAYSEALDALNAPQEGRPTRGPKAGTLGWLATRYFASQEFLALDDRANRRRVIENCLIEPLKPGGKDLVRDVPIRFLSAKHVKMLRDRKAALQLPAAANNRRKYLGAMFSWAVEADHMSANPARDTRRKKYATTGFHTWTVDEVRKFEERHPIGTKARLALGLLLFLGYRPGDTRQLGRQHVKDGLIGFVPGKTKKLRKDLSWKPILPVLQQIIDATPRGALTFIETEYGRAFSAKGFGNKMRQWCDEAGLPHCSAHGLRKAGATIAAENGATAHQLMALYDWSTLSQAEPYTRSADKKRLAAVASKLIGDHMGNAECPTEVSHQKSG